jgi:hypothetical protein
MHRPRTILIGSLSLLVLLGVALGAIATAGGATRGADRVESVSVPSAGVDRVDIELAPDVAQLVVRPLPLHSASLLEGSLTLLANERLLRDDDPSDDGRVALRARSRLGVATTVRGPVWDLGLARHVPTRLRVRTDVGDLDLDLRGTRVDTLESVSDIGRQTVRLPDHDLTGTLRTDVGRLELIVPHDADVRIDVRAGLRRVDADPAFRRAGRTWHLDGDGAALELDVRVGMGHVLLRRAAPEAP